MTPESPESPKGLHFVAGDFTIDLPQDLSPISPSAEPENLKTLPQLLKKKIAPLFLELTANKYKQSKLSPRFLTGETPIPNEEVLARAVMPSNDFLAENMLEPAKRTVESKARAAFVEGRPLIFHVYPGTLRIAELAQGANPSLDLYDHLFVKQISDYLQTLKAYGPGCEAHIVFDDSSENWVFQPLLPSEALQPIQQAHMQKMKDLVSQLLSGSSVQFTQTSAEFNTAELDERLQEYKNVEQVMFALSQAFLARRRYGTGVGAPDWARYVTFVRNMASAKGGDHGKQILAETGVEFANELKGRVKLDNFPFINQFTPYRLQYFIGNVGNSLQAAGVESKPVEVPTSGWEVDELAWEISRRLLVREFYLNEQYSTNSEGHIAGIRAITRIYAGGAANFKEYMRRFGMGLTLSGLKHYGKIPMFETAGIQIGHLSNESPADLTEIEDHSPIPGLSPVSVTIDGLVYQVPITKY